jgi:hypothetical protein
MGLTTWEGLVLDAFIPRGRGDVRDVGIPEILALVLALLVLNTGLIVATFMSGVPYFVDAIGTLMMFAMSILLYRWWPNR